MNYPITPAIRVLREKKVDFEPHVFEYVEKGGTKHSSQVLGVDEHAVVKTLIFETNEKKPYLNVKTVAPVAPEKASKLTGYLVGGTSPFGAKTKMPVMAEKTIFDLPKIFINGGKRGFLVAIDPKILKDVLPLEEVEVKQNAD
jgi:prolyl-tRNA editing enzyme YbaK/EbsC (Cys-tRNA(Pro) deacylase)